MIAGAITLCLLITLAYVAFEASESQEAAYHDHATRARYAAVEREFEEKCSDIVVLDKLRHCFQSVIGADWDTQRAQEDLKAQKDVARYGLWMFRASVGLGVLSLIVGGVGIYYVRETLVATQEISKKELRAYMYVDDFYFSSEQDSKKDTFRVTLKNSGSTPAIGAWGYIGASLVKTADIQSFNFDGSKNRRPGERSIDNIGTHGIYQKTIESVTLRMAAPAMINSGEWTFFIYGTVLYDDVFGDHHTTTFRLQWGGEDPNLRRYGLVVSPEGNEMT